MNAKSLLDLVKRRVPGFDDSEYLSEINQAYSDVWEEITLLDNSYFSDIKTITVTTQSDEFDLLTKAVNNYSGNAIPPLSQITRIRVLPPAGFGWIPAEPVHFNHPDYLAQQQNSQPGAQTTGPYLYVLYGKGKIKFGLPLAVNSQIEITYEMAYFDLKLLTTGTVDSTGTNVTGTGTSFTELLPPDFQAYLPGSDIDAEIGAEIIVGGKTYRVTSIGSNTALVTATAISPAASASAFSLASVPAFPEFCHNVIADIATRNILSTPAEDDRFVEWAAIATASVEKMKATLLERQRQRNARKQRFPYGAIRRGRYAGVR